jgi:hypothetical protein
VRPGRFGRIDGEEIEKMPANKNRRLKYGEGQREQYEEGRSYRPEDKSEAADNIDEHGFAGGERDDKAIPDTRRRKDSC